MHLNYQHIGARIKVERKHMRLSQAQLAELVDLSVQYISQIERGVRHLSLDVMADIAVALNASVDLLLFGTCCTEVEKIFCDRKAFSECSLNEKISYWSLHWLQKRYYIVTKSIFKLFILCQ